MGDDATSPHHYTRLDPEPIDVITSWRLDFCLGNAVKYIARHGHKPGVDAAEDLAKAAWYLDRARRGAGDATGLDGMTLVLTDELEQHLAERDVLRRENADMRALIERGKAVSAASGDVIRELGDIVGHLKAKSEADEATIAALRRQLVDAGLAALVAAPIGQEDSTAG